MKKVFLPFIFLFLFFPVIGQDLPSEVDSDKVYHSEIGLNVTSFIQNILGFSNNDFRNASPYLITYKYHFKKRAFRFGLGGAFSSSEEKESGASGTLKVDDYQTDIRAGFEFQSFLSKRWTFYAGVDAIVELSSLKTISNQDFDKVTTENSSQGFGGGPILGIQFNINSRLNISTDAALFFLAKEDKRKVSSANFPEFNSSTKEDNLEILFTVPFSIFLKFRI